MYFSDSVDFHCHCLSTMYVNSGLDLSTWWRRTSRCGCGLSSGRAPASGYTMSTRTTCSGSKVSVIEEDSDRREGKGRLCWLGDGTDLIPCRTSHLAQDDLKKRITRETATWRNGYFRKMDDHLVTLHPTTTLPKWMFFQKLFLESSLLLNGLCGIQVRPPTSSPNICLPFCLILILLLRYTTSNNFTHIF